MVSALCFIGKFSGFIRMISVNILITSRQLFLLVTFIGSVAVELKIYKKPMFLVTHILTTL